MITHTQAILGVYDFLLSDEYNQSYIKNVLALPFIMAGMVVEIFNPQKSVSIHHKKYSTWLWVVKKGLLSLHNAYTKPLPRERMYNS